MRVVKHCHRMPREVMDASPLETFKARLDRTLSHHMQLNVSPLLAAGGDKMSLNGPFQSKLFYDSMIRRSLELVRKNVGDILLPRAV